MEQSKQESISSIKVEVVNTNLLDSIKNFMDDLANVTSNKDFKDYHTIVKRIDKTKVKAYTHLINGFKNFFTVNTKALINGDFDSLSEPYISYITDNGLFNFNLQNIYREATDDDQDVIKDHLNHIWVILNSNETPEEKYINKIFKDLKSRFSPDMTREEQMIIVKDLFNDFQKQNLDMSIIIKIACKKTRELLKSNGVEDHSQTLILIDAVEEIDINNFNMVEFMALVGKIGTLFSNGENNPLNDFLTNIFNNSSPLMVKDTDNH